MVISVVVNGGIALRTRKSLGVGPKSTEGTTRHTAVDILDSLSVLDRFEVEGVRTRHVILWSFICTGRERIHYKRVEGGCPVRRGI